MPGKKSFLLRLSQEMWEELERWAGDDFRSVNGQIESILHEAIVRRRKKAPPAASVPGEDPVGNKPAPEEKE
jgi:hypothetical protein